MSRTLKWCSHAAWIVALGFWPAVALVLLASAAIGQEKESEAKLLCTHFGGLKEIISTSDETSPMFGREVRLFVRCKDGSYVSRTRAVK